MPDRRPLRVFISYASESTEHNAWVKRLADAIEEADDFHVVFDQYDLHAGKDLAHFMDTGLECDRIIAVITPSYVQKAHSRRGGVGYESSVVSSDLLSDQLTDRFVPVLRSGNERPAFLRSKLFVDFRKDSTFSESLYELRSALLGLTPATRPTKHATISSTPEATSFPSNVAGETYWPTKQTDNPEFVFSEFVPSAGSQVALAAAVSVSESPGLFYNPLFLHGRPASGKTHLLHAITQAIRERGSRATVLRISCDQYLTLLFEAIRQHRRLEFRRTLASIDVLLIDDIQFLAGKDVTQGELFNLLEESASRGSQVVVTCDVPPAQLSFLESHVRVQFEAGLICEIGLPDLEARQEIARRIANKRRLALDEKVVRFLAACSPLGARQLQSYVTRLAADVVLKPRTLTVRDARSVLHDLLPPRSDISRNVVIDAVAQHYGLTSLELLTTPKLISLDEPRRVAYYLLQRCSGVTTAQVATLFKIRRTTVADNIVALTQSLGNDRYLAESIRVIEGVIRRSAQ